MANFNVNLDNEDENFEVEFGEVTNLGTPDYNVLQNKPQINGVTLEGNKTSEDLGIKTDPVWGEITGDIDNQTDLKNVLDDIIDGSWLKEEVTELPENPSDHTIYIQRQEGTLPLYSWTYQNRTGFKFYKDEGDDLIATPTELNNILWDITSQVGGFYLGSNNVQMYQQFGSGSKPYTELQLTSTREWEDVESLFVFSAGGSHTGEKYIKCKVEIGDGEDWTLIGEQDVGTLTNGYCNQLSYTNDTDVKDGFIRLTFTQNTNKAFYLNGISVNTVATVVPAYKIYTDGEWYTLNTTPEETVEAKIPTDIAQTYTADESGDTSYTSGEIHLVNKDGEQIGSNQVVKWAATAGNTIYAKSAQYDVEGGSFLKTYATDLSLENGTDLTLYSKSGDQLAVVDLSGISGELIDLGEIDLADYDYDPTEFMATVTQTGRYKFTDAGDNFEWYLNVINLGTTVQQIYWYSEEGPTYIKLLAGDYNSASHIINYHTTTSILTENVADGKYANKNHVHYTQSNINVGIQNYLTNNPTLNGEYRINCLYDKHFYIVRCYTVVYNPGTGSITRRAQIYFDLSEPWKTYSRYGTVSGGTTTWSDWHVTEGTVAQ